MPTTKPDDLRRQLDAYISGRLGDAESARLSQRITSDPSVARAYATAKQDADCRTKVGQSSTKCSVKEGAASTSSPTGRQRCSPTCPLKPTVSWGIVATAAALLSLAIAYVVVAPALHRGSAASPLRLTTQIRPQQIKAGEAAVVRVRLDNCSGQSQPMTVAIIGLPSGVEPRIEQIEQLAAARTVDSYEFRQQAIAFYWRGLPAAATGDKAIQFDFTVVGKTPGRSEGPASRAYPVYSAERKHIAEPLAIEIAH
jgi:hypothetical protein